MSDNESTHAQTTPSANMESTLLGHGSDWWNAAMLVSLGLAAFVAFLVAMATAGVIVIQKREAIAAGERIAGLEKETADAKLATERLKKEVAWRELDRATAEKLTAELSKKPSSVTLVYLPNDPEATQYCAQFIGVFRNAGWKLQVASRMFLGPPMGIVITQNDTWDAEAQADIRRVRKAFADAGLEVTKGGGALEANVPGLKLRRATAKVRVVFGFRPMPELK